jgi:hypothetical protein
MPRRSKALLDRAERAKQSALPVVVLIYGDPEATRLLGRSLSAREAMIGTELFEATESEGVKQFHRRLADIAHERIVGLDRRITIVSVGDDEPQKESIFNLDGTLKTPPVEGHTGPPGDAACHWPRTVQP